MCNPTTSKVSTPNSTKDDTFSSSSSSSSSQQQQQPAQHSVLTQILPYVVLGFGIMNGLYHKLVQVNLPKLLNMPPVATEFCTNSEEGATTTVSSSVSSCSRPDLIAFAIISEITFILCGGIGIYNWYFNKKLGTNRSKLSSETRLFGTISSNIWLTIINLTYQIWDFYVSYYYIADFNTSIMMTHHVVAGLVGAYGLYTNCLHQYSTFFMGLSEVSSIFLVICDLGRYYPPLEDLTPNYHFLVNGLCIPLFVLTFFYYRVFLWWPISYQFITDIYNVVIKNKTLEKIHSNNNASTTIKYMLYQLICFNIPMGLLQLYWATLILIKMKEMITTTESS